jgi:hypothetical protein
VLCDRRTTVSFFLDLVFFSLGDRVRAFSYGEEWLLYDKRREVVLDKIGANYAKTHLGEDRDSRLLSEVGIFPDSSLEAISRSSARRRLKRAPDSRQLDERTFV